VVAAFVVIFHHIDILNPSLAMDNAFGAGSARHLRMPDDERSLQLTSVVGHLVGVGPGHVAVQCFFVLCGFVSALPGLNSLEEARRCCAIGGFAGDSKKLGAVEKFFKSYQRILFKRFWRLALPVIPVQIVHATLWHYGLASGPYDKFPSPEVIREAYTQGIQSVFTPVLSGVLWVVENFLIAPFLVAAFLLPGFNLETKRRMLWYCMLLAYLIGNVYREETISAYLSVALGMVFCDLHVCESTGCEKYRRVMKHPLMQLFLLVIFALPWFPAPVYAHRMAMILCASAFVLLALYSPLIRCLMDNKLMSLLAPYTYELYIWHPVILSLFEEVVRPKLDSDIVLYIIGYGAVFIVTFVAYWLFEKPGMHFTDHLYKTFSGEIHAESLGFKIQGNMASTSA
jgi:peptidoglycan/LPS O-acetylase OafA/YrhL